MPLELHVFSAAFDEECASNSRSQSSDNSDTDDTDDLWDASSDTSSVHASPYDVCKVEAYLYYFGLQGLKRRGPKLVFRTSKDVFKKPSGPGQDVRPIQLLPVYTEHHVKLCKDDVWNTIRSKVVQLLGEQKIKFSSIDLARFRWLDEEEDDDVNVDNKDDREDRLGDKETGDSDGPNLNEEIAPYGKLITTPVTFWIGVLPDSLSGEQAHHSSQAILALLEGEYGITDVDIAYRESTVKFFSGPELFAPVSDFDPLRNVIDSVTTALSLPIAGLKSLKRQGTLGFYFRVKEALYGVTARHVLFSEEEANDEYRYVSSAPRKDVVLMGNKAYTNFLISIQSHISTLNGTTSVLEKRATSYRMKLKNDPNAVQVIHDLGAAEHQLKDMQTMIEALKKFFVKMKKEWERPKDRVIGHVVWAPAITCNNKPYGYTKDVCVIKLNEEKFLRNFKKNVIDLGTEIESGKFIKLMYPRDNVRSDFDYPHDRLLKLRVDCPGSGPRTSRTQVRTGPTGRSEGPVQRLLNRTSKQRSRSDPLSDLTLGVGPGPDPDLLTFLTT